MYTDYLNELENINDKGFVFTKKIGEEDVKITYAKAYKKSLYALAALQKKGVQPGSQIIFQLKDEEEFIYLFWACLQGGFVPVPLNVAVNFEQRMQLAKIWGILDSPYMLTDLASKGKHLSFFKESYQEIYREVEKKMILVDEIDYSSDKSPILYQANGNDTAILMFSSGSTGEPKAVTITYQGLISNTDSLLEKWKINSNEDCSVSWMPLTHAMGLIFTHMTVTRAKITQVIISSDIFVSDPVLWLRKLDQYKATITSSPNFGLQHVINALDLREDYNINLSKVRMIMNAAEPITVEVCNQFLESLQRFHLDKHTILPVLGMTEATAGVSMAEIGAELNVFYLNRKHLEYGKKIQISTSDDPDAIPFVSLGKPLSCCVSRICGEDNRVLGEDTIGSIQINGDSVMKGYYKNEEATKRSITKEGWLITGDLGFIHDGELIITGREKDVIFVKGQNFYVQDIERVASTAEGVEDRKIIVCAVQNRENKNDGVGVFVQYTDDLKDFIPIIRSIKKTVNRIMGLEVYDVIPVNDFCKTVSGKVSRMQISKKYNTGEYIGILLKINNILIQESFSHENELPKTENVIEESLVKIWSDILGKRINSNSEYFSYGVDSFKLLEILAVINRSFNVSLDMSDIYDAQNIKKLGKIIELHEKREELSSYPQELPDSVHKYEPFPLTEIQMSYLLGRNDGYELGGGSTHLYLELKTKLDIKKVNKALCKVIKKHAMLRAVFIDDRQQILERVDDYEIEIEDLCGAVEEEVKKRLKEERDRVSHYVFDPNKWPLFEFKAIISDKECYLLIGVDLLIADAPSLDTIAADLLEFYNNEELVPEEALFTYRDYVCALQKLKKSELYKHDKIYWKERLEDFPNSPHLPVIADYSQIDKPQFKRIQTLVPADKWKLIKEEASRHNITVSTVFCTIYLEVLSVWSNQPKLAINLTAVNRCSFHQDVQKLVGDFTTTIPLAADFSENSDFWVKAQTIQKEIMNGLEHRHYDGVEFIRELAAKNDYVNRAVIPVVFTSMIANPIWDRWTDIGEINYIISQTSQVYLDFQVSEVKGELLITWDYAFNILSDKMIRDMFEQYMHMLLSIVHGEMKRITISDNDLCMVQEYNNTSQDLSSGLLHKFFEIQADKHPDHIAVIDGDTSITYCALNKQANKVARMLKKKGIKQELPVGVLGVRCKETIINLLGILKAGGAYVPIDPQYPQERINFIMEHSNCDILLKPDVFEDKCMENYSDKNLNEDILPGNVAYVIYTSGSTGKPKGVAITHEAAVNTIMDINQRFEVNEKDKILGISSLCFDLSVYDIFGSLFSGAALVQIPDQRDVFSIYEIIEREKITIWNSVPAIMDMLLEHTDADRCNNSVRLVLLSGDWIPVGLSEKVKRKFVGSQVISLGGATEASIWSIYYPIDKVEESWKSIPYGMPLANQKYYVLNYRQEICPIGVEGELYIGGKGLLKEYYHDTEKTAAAIIVHKKLGKLYRTGDFGILRKDTNGNLFIEFTGRKDTQVKIGGHRIELSEIEKNLLAYTSIRSGTILVREDSNNKKYLCAYYVSDKNCISEDLKKYMGRYLPSYMIPEYFIPIDELPLTPNGKIDRKALLKKDKVLVKKEYIGPRDEIEKKIHHIFCEVLEETNIGIDESLFTLNLNSIKMIKIISRLEKELEIKVPFKKFIKRNNIVAITELVKESIVAEVVGSF